MENIKKYTSAKYYEDVMEPLLFIGRFTGVAPFNIIKNRKNITLKTNYISVICVVLCLFIYTCFVVKNTYYGEAESGRLRETPFLVMIRMYRMEVTYSFTVILYMVVVMKKHVYELIITSLKDIDIMMRYLGVDMNYNNLKWNHITVCCILEFVHITYIIVTLVLAYTAALDNINSVIILHAPLFAMNGTVIIFGCLINLIHLYLKSIKDQLLQLFNKSPGKKTMIYVKALETNYKGFTDETMRKNDILERLHLIFKTYDKICSCSSIINKCFSWNMLNVLSISYLTMIFNHFYILMTCISLIQGVYNVSDIIFLLMQFIITSINMYVSIKSCSRCEAESNEIRKVLGKILIEESDEEISTKLHQITSYLIMRCPNFSASDLFDINSTLSFSMMGSATLYLIILLQLTIDAN